MSPDEDASRRCAACKFLRRRCSRDCVLAPHFPASDPHRYACVQRVFGAGNTARMLQQLPVQERGAAADSMAAEAYRRVQDPVYGCAGVINRLQDEIRAAQCELAWTNAQIAMHRAAAHARTAASTSQWQRSNGGGADGARTQHQQQQAIPTNNAAWQLDDLASEFSFP
ncbi:LOB domain-containing protein 24-like [Oryza brachyantha]|uniref:LOB domain-containing protein 24-like n=1 Tax=Oryza brachyantha TaxID=4533 RepID=UPI0003EABEE9|nr:LOB domain-containing protein 24-like [Oryza brachyantha]